MPSSPPDAPATTLRVQPSRLCKSKQQAQYPPSSHRTTKSFGNKPVQKRIQQTKTKSSTTKMADEGSHQLEDATQSANTVDTPSISSNNPHIPPQATAATPPAQEHKRIIPDPTILSESKRRKPLLPSESPESNRLSGESKYVGGTGQTDPKQEFALESRSTDHPELQSGDNVPKSQHSAEVENVENKDKQKALTVNLAHSSEIAEPEPKNDNKESEASNIPSLSDLLGRASQRNAFYARFPLEVPKGHKFIHVMRHCRSWQNLSPRNEKENLSRIHDPGLTPGGSEDAKNFTKRYRNLRNPTVVVTSPLRRCLQTITLAFGDQIQAGKLRAIANPDLQEVSTSLCDTGTPLDVLREEFPLVLFPDELFPDVWPRDRNIMPQKEDTIYDDVPSLLASRELRVREWLRTLDDSEIVLITHGSFAHFIFNAWRGEPGDSESRGMQLKSGETVPMTLPDKSLPMANFRVCGSVIHIGPSDYFASSKDDDPEVYLRGQRDCGIFTPENLR